MAHTHLHDHADLVSRRTRRTLVVVVVTLAALTVLGMVLLWPGPVDRSAADDLGLVRDVYAAEVERVTTGPCAGTREADGVECRRVRFRLLAGPDEGERRAIEFPRSAASPDLGPGDEIVLSYLPDAEPRFQYDYADRQRRTPLLVLLVLFVVAVVLLGRLRGFMALIGLGASIAVLLVFLLPALLEGSSPILVAIVASSAIAYFALFLAHGFRATTLVALLGTLAALAITVALAALFTELTELSGFVSEEAFLVTVGSTGLDVRGLVLAGMVIGALGALDDMTVTQASAIAELRAADPTMGRRDLVRAGLRVGRDHVASIVNTLALAYAGAALPLLLLFVLAQQSLGTVVNSEIVATEVVRTLVGSIGLVAAVPVTTWLAARVVAAPDPGGAGPGNRGDRGGPAAGDDPGRGDGGAGGTPDDGTGSPGAADEADEERGPESPAARWAAETGGEPGLEETFWSDRRP